MLADSGLAALAGGHAPGTGRRVEHESLTGFGATLDVAARQGFGALRADLVAATATDEATGRTTVVLKAAAGGDGLIDVDGRAATARLAGDERVAVTLAPDGRPLDLVVARTGEVGGSIDLPLSLRAKPLPQNPARRRRRPPALGRRAATSISPTPTTSPRRARTSRGSGPGRGFPPRRPT